MNRLRRLSVTLLAAASLAGLPACSDDDAKKKAEQAEEKAKSGAEKAKTEAEKAKKKAEKAKEDVDGR
jgi:hypothetical protein